MSKKWKQLTLDEVKNHPLNKEKGLKSFITVLLFLSILGLGQASREVFEIYKNISDISILPSQGFTLLIAIIPPLVFSIIFWYLRNHKTKNTLKILITTLWLIPVTTLIHSFIFWKYLGIDSIPNEFTLSIIGKLIWVIIFTIGLTIYSYFSKTYNLQYLHRVVKNLEPSTYSLKNPQLNKTISAEPKLGVVNYNHKQNSKHDVNTTNTFQYIEVELPQTISAKLNKILFIVYVIAIVITTPFAYNKYKENLNCIKNQNISDENWDKEFQKYMLEFEEQQNQMNIRSKETYKNCLSRDGDIFQKFSYSNEECNFLLENITTSNYSKEDLESNYRLSNPKPYYWCKY